jgi:DNA polymerase (family 10)
VQAVVSVLREHASAVAVSEAGSVRRRKETFRDLDIIATATDPAELTTYFTQLAWVIDIAAHGDTKATVVSNEGLRFDLRVVPPESFGNLLQHFTGSKEHNVAMREEAVWRGLLIFEYRVTTGETGGGFASENEDASTSSSVTSRSHRSAQNGEPRLHDAASCRARELADVRGDLHAHALVRGRQEHTRADGRGSR